MDTLWACGIDADTTLSPFGNRETCVRNIMGEQPPW
jgi:hypothetical protein